MLKETSHTHEHACMIALSEEKLPYASHLLYTQKGVLDDQNTEERALGIAAGLVWGEAADKTIVYTDFGISGGMQLGVERAKLIGRPVEYRELNTNRNNYV